MHTGDAKELARQRAGTLAHTSIWLLRVSLKLFHSSLLGDCLQHELLW